MRAVIVGGGIAGSATALAVHQQGIDAAVFEAHPTGADGVGAFMTVMSNGIDVLRRLEADTAARQYGVSAGGVEALNADGEAVGSKSPDPDIPTPFTLTRSDLAAALRGAATRRGIPVSYGKQISEAHETPTGVTATFTDGTHCTGDILVGADGLWSTTRRLLNPQAPEPRACGTTVVFGFGARLIDPPPDGYVRFCFGHQAFFGYKKGATGDGWWFARLSTDPQWQHKQSTPELWKQRVLAATADDHTPSASVVENTGDQIIAIDTYDLIASEYASTPIWHNSATVLVGDAAHAADPATGQGAAHALEDAVVLADRLNTDSTPEQAFVAYEKRRRDVVEAEARKSSTMLKH